MWSGGEKINEARDDRILRQVSIHSSHTLLPAYRRDLGGKESRKSPIEQVYFHPSNKGFEDMRRGATAT